MKKKELIETLKVLLTPELMKAIKRGKEDLKAGRYRKYEDFAKEQNLI